MARRSTKQRKSAQRRKVAVEAIRLADQAGVLPERAQDVRRREAAISRSFARAR